MTTIQQVDAATLATWLEQDTAILIDVREPVEFLTESIDAAINIPLTQFDPDNFSKFTDIDKEIVIQCQSGKRSMLVCERVIEDYPTMKISNLHGGILAWKQHGLPTKTL